MKNFLFIFLFILAVSASASERITAVVSFTNAPANNDTITYNGDVRTWKTTVATAASQIATTNNAANSATNYYRHITQFNYTGRPLVSYLNETNVQIIANSGTTAAASISGTYAILTLSTQQVSDLIGIRVPISGEPTAWVRTNNASGIVAGISTYATNAIPATAIALSNHVNLTESQTVSGAKNFTGGFSGTAENITNGIFNSPTFTNGANYGLPFRSPGTEPLTEQFGANTQAINEGDNAFGYTAVASGGYSLALGLGSISGGYQSIAIGGGEVYTNSNLGVAMGQGSIAEGFNTLAIGQLSYAGAKNASAFGSGAHSNHTNSTAIGVGSSTTDTNQVFLGQASGTVVIPGGLTVGGVTTNFHMAGTNTIDGAIGFTRKNNSSLANGNNAAVATGTNTFIKLSGPTASFTINGLADYYEGKVIVLLNSTTYNFTIANDSGVDPTAANRILTRTGADVTITSTAGPGAATLIYDSSVARWILISTN